MGILNTAVADKESELPCIDGHNPDVIRLCRLKTYEVERIHKCFYDMKIVRYPVEHVHRRWGARTVGDAWTKP